MIHPDARVDPTADLGDGVEIGPGTIVGRDVRVGAGASIGARCRIHDGVRLDGGVRIDDEVLVGPAAILTNDRYPRAIAWDGDPADGDGSPMAIRLEHGASIGAGAIVVGPCDVRRFATVGAGAVVSGTVPAHALVAGVPARRIGWVCACGRRLDDSNGAPAPPVVERYGSDPFLNCPRCERRYVYVPDDDDLEERQGPRVRQGAGA